MRKERCLIIAMKKFFTFAAVVAIAALVSCQKQQTEAEKNAEVERQVQEKRSLKNRAPLQLHPLLLSNRNLNKLLRACVSPAHVKVAKARQLPAIQLFIPSSSLMARGWRPLITAMFGNRAKPKARGVGVLTRTVAGFTPTPAGLGFLKSHSVGRPIITGAGRVCVESAGSGFRAMNGRRPGFRGARATITSAGRRCPRKRGSISAPASTIGLITITTSGRTNIPSSQPGSLARSGLSPRSCRRNAMSLSSIRPPTSPISPTTTQRSSTKVRIMTRCVRKAASQCSGFDFSGT